MKFHFDFSKTLQIIANVAIIFGLIIVVFELNQTRQLSYSSSLLASTPNLNDRYLTVVGEDAKSSLVRAVLHPSKITEEDAAVLDALYRSITLNWFMLVRAAQIDGIERPWKGIVGFDTRTYFTTESGKRWIREYIAESNQTPIRQTLSAEVSSILATNPAPTLELFYRAQLASTVASPKSD